MEEGPFQLEPKYLFYKVTKLKTNIGRKKNKRSRVGTGMNTIKCSLQEREGVHVVYSTLGIRVVTGLDSVT